MTKGVVSTLTLNLMPELKVSCCTTMNGNRVGPYVIYEGLKNCKTTREIIYGKLIFLEVLLPEIGIVNNLLNQFR